MTQYSNSQSISRKSNVKIMAHLVWQLCNYFYVFCFLLTCPTSYLQCVLDFNIQNVLNTKASVLSYSLQNTILSYIFVKSIHIVLSFLPAWKINCLASHSGCTQTKAKWRFPKCKQRHLYTLAKMEHNLSNHVLTIILYYLDHNRICYLECIILKQRTQKTTLEVKTIST